jgi:imidazolonepropionase-like amidohydrolase/GMP synthase-like glutamine amidotransferase
VTPAKAKQPAAFPWAVLQHVAWEGPGTIASEATARGLELELFRMDKGERVPPAEEFGGVIVMGGPMSVHDTADHPHLVHERRLLRDAVERDIPILGVCLGAQLLASALDARVEKGPVAEVGIGEVTLTPEGRSDSVIGPDGDTLPVVHWHEETFHVPERGVLLAGSGLYKNQAFRFGRHAYAFQFHVEVDRSLASAWAPMLPAGTLEESRRAEVERTGRAILGRFFDLALSAGRGVACVAAMALSALAVAPARAQTPAGTAAPTTVVLECDRYFDGAAMHEGAARVVVTDGKIAAVGANAKAPEGASIVDLRGMTLLPGLIDVHTHMTFLWTDTTKAPNYLNDFLGSPIVVAFEAAKNAERTLRAGFTTVREMGDADGIDLALSQAVGRGLMTGPRIIVSGPIYPPSGGRPDIRWPPDGTAATAEEIAKKSREYLGSGCDWIKLYVTGGTFDDTSGTPFYTRDEIHEAVEVAHPRGRWVAAHAMGLEGARRAVEAGVRSLEHGSRLDEKVVKEMARRGTYLDPTLYHLQWYSDHGQTLGYSPGYVERLAALQKEQFASLKLAKKAGVKIACGSDAVYSMHGENAHELIWLTRAGLTPIEALRAATTVNAELLGLDHEIGKIAVGYAADLVAVPGDPSHAIDAVLSPRFVMKGGQTIVAAGGR